MSETAHLSTTQDQPSKPTKSGKKASAAIQWMPTTQIGAPVEGSRKASKRSTVHIDTKYSEDNLMKTRQRIFKEHLSTVQMLDKLKEEKQKQMEDQSTVPPIDEDFIQLYNKYEQQKVILGEIDEFLDDLQNPSSHKLSASTLEALEQQLQITKKKSYKYKLQRLYSSELNEELLPKESLGNKMSIFEPGELENVLSELGRTVVSNILATQKSLDEQKKKEQLSIGEQFIQEKHKERELRRKAREKKMKQNEKENPSGASSTTSTSSTNSKTNNSVPKNVSMDTKNVSTDTKTVSIDTKNDTPNVSMDTLQSNTQQTMNS